MSILYQVCCISVATSSAGEQTMTLQNFNGMLLCFVGLGIPNEKMHENNRTAKIIPIMVPSPKEAVFRFHSMGGELTLFPAFGEDPLPEFLAAIWQEEFLRKFPDLHLIFSGAVNGDERPFRDGLQYILSVTKRLARSA